MDEREVSRRLRAEIDSVAVPEPAPARRRPLRSALPLVAAGAAVLVLALAAGRLLSVIRNDRSDVAAPTSTATSSASPPTATSGPRPVAVAFTVVTPPEGRRETLHGFSDRPGVVLVTSTQDLDLIRAAPGGKLVETALDGVDLTKQAVLAVFAGAKPCLGYAISVSEVLVGPSPRVELRTAQTGPGPSDVCLTAISYPMELVAVDRAVIPLGSGTVVTATNADGTALATTRWCTGQPVPGRSTTSSFDCAREVLGTESAAQIHLAGTTVEGDPIPSTAFVRGNGPSKVVRDFRADRFSAPADRRLFVYVCAGVHVPGPGSNTPMVFGACEGDGDSTTLP